MRHAELQVLLRLGRDEGWGWVEGKARGRDTKVLLGLGGMRAGDWLRVMLETETPRYCWGWAG